MNLSLDANKPFTIYIYKCCPYPVFCCITEFSDFQYYIAGAILTPRYQKTARSRSSLSIPERPFLLLIYKWSWFVPMSFKEPWQIFLTEVTSSICYSYTIFPSPQILERERVRALTEYQIKLGTTWRIRRNVSCCSRLPSRTPQYCIFNSLPY